MNKLISNSADVSQIVYGNWKSLAKLQEVEAALAATEAEIVDL